MRRLILVPLLLIAIGFEGPSAQAVGRHAGGADGGAVSTPASQSVVAFVRQWEGGGPGRPAGASSCGRWARATTADANIHAWDLVRFDGEVHWRLYMRTCLPTTEQTTWVPDGPLDATPTAMREILAARGIPEPEGRFAPPVDEMYVNLGTWIWVDPAQWTDRRAHSLTIGFPDVTVTVWVEPAGITYDSGLGSESTTCAGNGPVWAEVYGDDTPSACMFTYAHSTAIAPSGHFDASLSVDWAVHWTRNGRAMPDLDPITTTSNYTVTVKERQAIVTG